MKKVLKGYLIGFLSAAVLVSGITCAANTTTLYDVIADGVKIVVDGKRLNPKDANGNEVQPMIYNGTTYLPVRAVANALGKAVYWDGPNYTVYLGEMNGELEYPTVYLKDMTNIGHFWYSDADTMTDNYGNIHNDALCSYSGFYGESEHEYLLNMKYSRFKATLFIPEGRTGEKETYIKIIADGKTIYTSPKMNKTSRPVEVDVSVKGCNDLKIYCSTPEKVYLANAGFYQ